MNSITKFNLEHYDNDSEFDKYSTWKNHQKRIELMLKFLDITFEKSGKTKDNFKIIDIGGNTGVISELVQDKGYDIVVADISGLALKKAKARGIKTLKLDFNENFSSIDKKYDVIIAGEIIEHILDVKKFLDECNNILEEDGYLILSTPNLANFKDRIRFLFGKMPRQINPFHEYLKLHIRQFSYSSLKEALNYSNFELLKFKSNYVALGSDSRPCFIRFLAVLFPKLGSSLIVLAQKKK